MGELDPRLENIFAPTPNIADDKKRAPWAPGAHPVEFPMTVGGGLLVLFLVGCATTPPLGRADLLNFLVDGNTAKEEVLRNLGHPSGTFDTEEIFTYRLGFEPKSEGYWVVTRETGDSPWPVWKCASYSLVLVFNDQEILQSHSLIQIKATGP